MFDIIYAIKGTIEIVGTSSWTQIPYHNGKRHGLSREFRNCKPQIPSPCENVYKELLQVSYYQNDRPIGISWRQLVGGSYMVGELDKESEEFSGRNILYLYPDLTSGIIGRFVDSKLITGHTCTVQDSEINDETGMLILKVLENKCDVSAMTKIKRDVSTHTRISKNPLVRDEWEKLRVEVRTSLIDTPDGLDPGEGLFAKCKIGKEQIVALFNGVRQEAINDSSSEYRIRLTVDKDIDIPIEYKDINSYCATLGHKTNHSFRPNSR